MKTLKLFLFTILWSLFFIAGQSQYVVTSIGDTPDATPGDNICADASGNCTLRAAMMEANAWAGHDFIVFNIQTGPQVIMPLTPLPQLWDPQGVTIDGLTQMDVTGATAYCDGIVPNHALLITIDGALAFGPPVIHGLWVVSDSNVIQGLVVNNFTGDGIRIEAGAGPNLPGSPFVYPHADDNIVTCNIIGVDRTGNVAVPNGMASLSGGIYAGVTIKNVVSQEPNVVTTALRNIVDANLISGNFFEGVQIIGPVQPGDVGFNQVLNNFVGTDLAGLSAIANNRQGINMSEGTHDNYVSSNLVSGNLWDGIGLQGFDNIGFLKPSIFTRNNTIADNRVGIDNNVANPQALPNLNNGISIGIYGPNGFWGYADKNHFINNTIWHNGGAGIAIWESQAVDPMAFPGANADENLLHINSIWKNGGLGIDLDLNGVTTNDVGDPDFFSNQELNYPTNLSFSMVAGISTVTGMAEPGTAWIEVYETNPDPSGHGEGKVFIDSTLVTGPNWSLTTNKLMPNSTITAIAIDGMNNTSEFAPNYQPPLSIRLISFDLAEKHHSIFLKWSIEPNEELTEVRLERAVDLSEFETIERFENTGEFLTGNFEFEDWDVGKGIRYHYRVVMKSTFGNETYSMIKSGSLNKTPFSIFPNPVIDGMIMVQFEEASSGLIEIISIDGRAIRSKVVSNQKAIEIDVHSELTGMYLVRFVSNQNSLVLPLIVL